jgi:hypothetical protein
MGYDVVMATATNIATRRNRDNASSVVEWTAGDHRYSRTFAGRPSRARQFADALRRDNIRLTSTGALRYRSYGRKGETLWVSCP